MKKLTQILALASVAALCLGNSMAQDSKEGPGGPGGPGGGGPGGGRDRGNFDPAKFQQDMQRRVNDQIKEQFGSTDEEWKVIEPLVAKVNELRLSGVASMGGMARMFGGGRSRGGDQGNRPRFGAEPSAEETALSEAIEKGAAKDELKAKMAAYRKMKATKAEELKTAQENLKKVLTTKQEAIALEMGLVQ